MNTTVLTLAMAGITIAGAAFAGTSDTVATSWIVEDKLVCGAAEVIAKSSCQSAPDQETQCRKQSLQLHNPGKGISKKLPHDGQPIRQPFIKDGPVLDAIATGWACVQTKNGTPLILVAYTCVEHDKRPECAGTNKEWIRAFGLDGKDFTKGMSRRSPAIDQAYERIGLSDQLKAGVQLEDLKH